MSEELNIENKGPHKNHVSEMYQNWFLDYASYVILERAVPAGNDGLACATPNIACFKRNG